MATVTKTTTVQPRAELIDEVATALGLRPVVEINGDLTTAKSQYQNLLIVCSKDHAAHARKVNTWEQERIKRIRGNGLGEDDEVSPLGPKPSLDTDSMNRANALHALAYVVADYEAELAAHSTNAQRRAYRQEMLSAAGVTLSVDAIPDENTTRSDEDTRKFREEILRKAGIKVTGKAG